MILKQGNCLELMKEIEDESIDLVITSPHYNAGKAYETKLSLEEYKQLYHLNVLHYKDQQTFSSDFEISFCPWWLS